MIADDDIFRFAAAADEKADLAADGPGQFREAAGDVMRDDLIRRDAPSV